MRFTHPKLMIDKKVVLISDALLPNLSFKKLRKIKLLKIGLIIVNVSTQVQSDDDLFKSIKLTITEFVGRGSVDVQATDSNNEELSHSNNELEPNNELNIDDENIDDNPTSLNNNKNNNSNSNKRGIFFFFADI
ncbi:hypothetical protein RhiirA4_429474 [Rhizophagus irregularis]|uniref:Uncharacterized protein n=1 Tax=Rhizophagus irregularis TaxID=588596 RepID=A0A2I1HGU4_9GLOM|nr:hypothetical protein RhiirA4_429474 [Rhizophagus irregularis]